MESNILQDFLSLRLVDIGAEDTRLGKLGDACDELAQQYSVKPISALAPLLAAWDPVAGEDLNLLAIGQVLQNHWPTYRGAFQSEPVTLYRAIVFEAVVRAMERQGTLAVAVHLLGANVFPHLKGGREQQPLSKLLNQAKFISFSRVTKQWPAQDKPVTVAPFEVPQTPALKKTDPSAWFAQVAATAGPSTNKGGISLTNPNPHWPNQAQHWSYEFAERLAPIFADVHDKAATTATKTSAEVLKVVSESVGAKLNGFLTAELARATRLQTSSRLLWWRQALYSETAAAPYRKLSPPLVALHMSLDLSELLPEVYPPAVESLLYEAVRAATGGHCEEQVTMKELLEAQCHVPQVAALNMVQKLRSGPLSRLLFIQALANSCASEKIELPQLGVDPQTKLELGEWAIWLLREIKALGALSAPDKIAPKRKSA